MPYLYFIYTSSVFGYYEYKKKFWHSLFNEIVPVTYEPAAILNNALLCIKMDIW